MLAFLFTGNALAQENIANTNINAAISEAPEVIVPIITSRSEVEVGKKFILNASRSEIPRNVPVTYAWEFSDGAKEEGEEIVHVFDKPGTYSITLRITAGSAEYTAKTEIFAYRQAVTFFYNGSGETFDSNIASIRKLAETSGIYLNIIQSASDAAFISEDATYELLLDKVDIIGSSGVIIGGPNATSFLSALSKVVLTTKNKEIFNDKVIIVSMNENLWLFSRMAQRLLGLMSPKEVLLIGKDPFSTLNFLLQSESSEDLLQKIPSSDYSRIDLATGKETILMPLSFLVTKGVTNGIPSQVLIFVLLIPIILTVIAFFKQVIGIDTVGIFQTIVLTLSFYILGIVSGTIILILSVLIGAVMRKILQRVHMLHVSKMTILLTISCLGILLLIISGSQFGIFFGIDRTNGQNALLSVLPMILIAAQADKLSYITSSWKNKKDLLRFLATYTATLVAYFAIQIPYLDTLLFAIPELVLLALVLQYMIGKYAGLRLVEYVRFRELFRHEIEE